MRILFLALLLGASGLPGPSVQNLLPVYPAFASEDQPSQSNRPGASLSDSQEFPADELPSELAEALRDPDPNRLPLVGEIGAAEGVTYTSRTAEAFEQEITVNAITIPTAARLDRILSTYVEQQIARESAARSKEAKNLRKKRNRLERDLKKAKRRSNEAAIREVEAELSIAKNQIAALEASDFTPFRLAVNIRGAEVAHVQTDRLIDKLTSLADDLWDYSTQIESSEIANSHQTTRELRANVGRIRQEIASLEVARADLQTLTESIESKGVNGVSHERRLELLGPAFERVHSAHATLKRVTKQVTNLRDRMNRSASPQDDPYVLEYWDHREIPHRLFLATRSAHLLNADLESDTAMTLSAMAISEKHHGDVDIRYLPTNPADLPNDQGALPHWYVNNSNRILTGGRGALNGSFATLSTVKTLGPFALAPGATIGIASALIQYKISLFGWFLDKSQVSEKVNRLLSRNRALRLQAHDEYKKKILGKVDAEVTQIAKDHEALMSELEKKETKLRKFRRWWSEYIDSWARRPASYLIKWPLIEMVFLTLGRLANEAAGRVGSKFGLTPDFIPWESFSESFIQYILPAIVLNGFAQNLGDNAIVKLKERWIEHEAAGNQGYVSAAKQETIEEVIRLSFALLSTLCVFSSIQSMFDWFMGPSAQTFLAGSMVGLSAMVYYTTAAGARFKQKALTWGKRLLFAGSFVAAGGAARFILPEISTSAATFFEERLTDPWLGLVGMALTAGTYAAAPKIWSGLVGMKNWAGRFFKKAKSAAKETAEDWHWQSSGAGACRRTLKGLRAALQPG